MYLFPYGGAASPGSPTPVKYGMPQFRAAMWKHLNKVSVAKIGVIGESHATGQGSTVSDVQGLIGAQPFCHSSVIANILGNRYGYISRDTICGDQNVTIGGVTYPQYDTRVTFGTGWASDISAGTLGGRYFVASGISAGVWSFQPANAYDRVVVYYPKAPSGSATLTVANGIGTLGTYSCNGANAVATTTLTTTLGSSPITIKNDASGTGFIHTVYCYNSANPGIMMFQGGWCGGTVAQAITSATPYQALPTLTGLDLDLAIIEIGINDAFSNTSAATIQSQFNTYLAAQKTVGDALVLYGFPCNNTNWTNNVDAYVAAMRTACDANQVNFIDMRQWFGSTWADANAAGLVTTASTASAAHPSKLGYSVYGQVASAAICSVL